MTNKNVRLFRHKNTHSFGTCNLFRQYFSHKSIFFLINQIAKRGQKSAFPKQTQKNDRKNERFSCQKTIINSLARERTGKGN